MPPTGPTSPVYAVVVPRESVTRTATVSVWPTSFGPRRWRFPATPSRIAQCAPIVVHRYQRYARVSRPVPFHEPGLTVSVAPCVAGPETDGRDSALGPEAAEAAAVPTAGDRGTQISAATKNARRCREIARISRTSEASVYERRKTSSYPFGDARQPPANTFTARRAPLERSAGRCARGARRHRCGGRVPRDGARDLRRRVDPRPCAGADVLDPPAAARAGRADDAPVGRPGGRRERPSGS